MSILSKFTVVDLIKTRSDSVVNITGNSIKFNNATAEELNFPSHIQLLINPKDKQFAIRGCKEDAPNALPFSKPREQQKYPIKFAQAAVVDMIRKMAEWGVEEKWNIPGAYFADECAIVYDIKTAVPPAEKKGGWAAKRLREEEEAAAAEAVKDSEI